MKALSLTFVVTLSLAAIAQKAEIVKENGKYGLKTDFGKELLPAEYESVSKCTTDSLDYFIASYTGAAELYSYSPKRRSIFEETQGQNFTIVRFEKDPELDSKQFYGITEKGEKFHLKGQNWEQIKVKNMIGCKDGSGKYAVCSGGKALTEYKYKGVDTKHKNLVLVESDSGWMALDAKMKSHYAWSFDEIHDSETHPESFIIKKGNKWGILSLDGSMNLPPSEMKNPRQMFDFDVASYAELERAYAVKRNSKWGIVNEENEELVDFRYDNAYMIDDFSIEKHGLKVHAVVKEGGTWRFLNEKWEEQKSLQFDKWVGVHGEFAFIIKEGKVLQLSLKTFDTQANLYFGEYDDYQVVKNEDGMEGLVDKQGKILMPFEFDLISLEIDEKEPFIIADKKGKSGIYDVLGKNLVPHNYEGVFFLETKEGKLYFSVGRVGEAGLAFWDEESGKLNIISERMYKLISFNFGDKSFKAETMDGVFHKLDDNGKMIETPEK